MILHCPRRFFVASLLTLATIFQVHEASAEVFHYMDRAGRKHRVQLASDAMKFGEQAEARDISLSPDLDSHELAKASEVAPADLPLFALAEPTRVIAVDAPGEPPRAASFPTPSSTGSPTDLRLPVVSPPPTELPQQLLFFPWIQESATYYSLPIELLLALIKVESRFQPQALSRKGAIGLTQLMPGTAADLGVVDPFDPRQNIFGGARYLRMLINEFDGQISLALAAYNAGAGAVRRAGGIPAIPETQSYVPAVLSAYRSYQVAIPRTQPRELPW